MQIKVTPESFVSTIKLIESSGIKLQDITIEDFCLTDDGTWWWVCANFDVEYDCLTLSTQFDLEEQAKEFATKVDELLRGIISKFDNEYSFLSNFYPCEITFDNDVYPSVEHAFQAAKTNDKQDREKIRNAETPGKAKRLGRKVRLIDSWNEIRLPTMELLIDQKFNNDVLKQKLIDTSDAILVEGNDWNDTFWGMCDGHGENWLGKILMKKREKEQLRSK